jgi:hypothetical protein
VQLHAVRRRARGFDRGHAADGTRDGEVHAFLDGFEQLSSNEVLLPLPAGILPHGWRRASINGPRPSASVRRAESTATACTAVLYRVPLGDVGDVYDRYYVRVLEMRERDPATGAG